ncbi:MAG: hypothetical protein AAF629_34570, partial [Chloroflexota bacterium]
QTLNEDSLLNGTYHGIYEEPIQLIDGGYEGAPFVEGGASRPMVWYIDNSTTFGDFDNDGVDEVVVHLLENSGGSGSFSYLALVDDQDGQVKNIATNLIGDRIVLHTVSIEREKIQVEMTTQGPGDAFCCASQRVGFALVPSEVQGMLVEADFEVLLPSISERLKNATYWIEDIEEPIVLADGRFEGKPFVEGTASRPTAWLAEQTHGDAAYTYGNLTGNNEAEGVVILAANLGGSGSFHFLIVTTLSDNNPTPPQLATAFLGDRIKVDSIYLEQGEIVLRLKTHGPNDGLCCPTQDEEWRFILDDGALIRTNE